MPKGNSLVIPHRKEGKGWSRSCKEMASAGGREDSKVAHKVFSCNISYIKEKANVDLTRLADKLKAKKIISQPDRDKAVDGYTRQTEAQRRGDLIDRVHENLRDGIGEAFEIFLDILREEETLKFDKLVAELEGMYDGMCSIFFPAVINSIFTSGCKQHC